jgi:ketosteroid isomerase-like protein
MSKDSLPKDIVQLFIERINAHQNQAIFDLKSDDFVFIDSGGKRHQKSQLNWDDYFVMFPDYTISVEMILTKGNTVVVLGSFSQTYAVKGELREENHYSVPAVWRAEVKEGLISIWQVYTDHTETWEIINRNKE